MRKYFIHFSFLIIFFLFYRFSEAKAFENHEVASFSLQINSFGLAPFSFSPDYPFNKNPLLILDDPEGKEFVKQLIMEGYSHYGIKTVTVNAIFEVLSSSIHDPETAVRQIYENIVDPTDPNGKFQRIYKNYKMEKKPKIVYSSFGHLIQGGIVIDWGCDDMAIDVLLVEKNQNIKRIIGFDLGEVNLDFNDQRLVYKKWVPGTRKIPLSNNSVQHAIFINVFHHLTDEQIEFFLKEMQRILTTGGTIIIMEDSYSQDLKAIHGNPEWIKKFLSFNKHQKFQIYRFFDWISTRLVHGKKEMPRPYNFKSIEELSEMLSKIGFKIIHQEFTGLLKESFHMMPKGVVVGENLPSIIDIETNEEFRKAV